MILRRCFDYAHLLAQVSEPVPLINQVTHAFGNPREQETYYIQNFYQIIIAFL